MADIDLNRSVLRAQPVRSDWFISAVQHVRRLNGGTQAHLMRASDSELYAVKFQNNPKSARALVSEFLATRLGYWLGLGSILRASPAAQPPEEPAKQGVDEPSP